MPRTYLVDSQGKILWFDMEYSRSTRRDLRDAIRVVLNTKVESARKPAGDRPLLSTASRLC